MTNVRQEPRTKTTTRPATWVAPYRDDEPRPLVRMAAPATADLLPPATATTTVTLATTYEDRARGWVIATTPLAATAAITAVLLAILGFAVPALSVAVLLVFFATFGAVWLLGWVAHLLIGPDGIAFLTAVFMYRLVRHEQRHRHDLWGRK